LYNEDIKNVYLKNILETKYKERCFELFKKSFEKEKVYGKDLFEFDRCELFQFTENKRELVLIRNYLDWATEQGYAFSNLNPLWI